MSASLFPLLIIAARERSVADALRDAQAVSPASACPPDALPTLPADAFARLLASGRVREGAPGTYYLYEDASQNRRLVMAKQAAFWLIIVLIPLAFLFRLR